MRMEQMYLRWWAKRNRNIKKYHEHKPNIRLLHDSKTGDELGSSEVPR